MATAVLDLDLNNLPFKITGLERYDKAFLLIRFKGKPIGKTIVTVQKGSIDTTQCYNKISAAVGSTLEDIWLKDYLEWEAPETIDFTCPTATVAVCTRDRPDDLLHCLDALMQLPDDGQEYLVIDNCPSSDKTEKLVKSHKRIKYILEKRPGLDVARNRALFEAKNEIVAFIDDDATPDPNWLRALLLNFNSPLVLCVTGLTMPVELETVAQETFENYCSFSKGFKRKLFKGNHHNPLATGQVGAGANMAVRRSVQFQVGLFDEALDAGTLTRSGGDHEFFARILSLGYHIVYDPAALNWHRHRQTWKELSDTLYGYGVGVYACFTKHLLINGEWGVFALSYKWFRYNQFPTLVKSILGRPGCMPLNLITAELKGCIMGPWAYISSRKKLKDKINHE